MRKIKFEYKITAAYAVIGGVWILFSDKLLLYFIKDTYVLTQLQTYKGWFYVIITALLLYSFLKKHLAKIRKAEMKAKESDKLKTAFLQNISHEIRTPMNGIIGFSGLLTNEDLTEEQKKKYLEMITSNSNQLLIIVNEILDISLIESGTIVARESRVHLNEFLDELYNAFKSSVNNEITLFLSKGLEDDLSIVFTDEAKIRQVLNNLITNAVKFTTRGHIRFGYSLKNKELEFFVEDTGIGIAPALHRQIFEPFRKAETEISKLYQGVGLGLAICKGNVNLLNGKIWLNSELNKGSVFFFTIPYKPADQH